MADPYLVFGQPVFDEETIDEIADSLRSSWVGTGPKAAEFGQRVADAVGARFGVPVASCTAGLHLSLLAAGIGPGDEVITTPLTFVSTVNVLTHVGARIRLVDVDPSTQNLNVDLLPSALTARTRAIMPVHMAGRPCDMDAIRAFAEAHDLMVIEDAAHALGAGHHGRMIGSISPLTAFSFYATKNVTSAEGGVVTTDREDYAELIETYALHGLTKGAWERYSARGVQHYAAVVPGFKYNLTDIHAAIGLHQIKHLTQWQLRREEIWQQYDDAFADLPLGLPAPPASETVHARHLYAVSIDPEVSGLDRDEFRQRLHERGIGTGIHFLPVHLHPYYEAALGLPSGSFPEAERIGRHTVSIPLTPHLSTSDVERVVNAVRGVLKGARSVTQVHP